MAEIDVMELSRLRHLVKCGAAKALREGAQLSIHDIARAADTYPATIFRWEKHERVPHGEPAMRYLKVLDRLFEKATS